MLGNERDSVAENAWHLSVDTSLQPMEHRVTEHVVKSSLASIFPWVSLGAWTMLCRVCSIQAVTLVSKRSSCTGLGTGGTRGHIGPSHHGRRVLQAVWKCRNCLQAVKQKLHVG